MLGLFVKLSTMNRTSFILGTCLAPQIHFDRFLSAGLLTSRLSHLHSNPIHITGNQKHENEKGPQAVLVPAELRRMGFGLADWSRVI
jgi:hypothetical protein